MGRLRLIFIKFYYLLINFKCLFLFPVCVSVLSAHYVQCVCLVSFREERTWGPWTWSCVVLGTQSVLCKGNQRS